MIEHPQGRVGVDDDNPVNEMSPAGVAADENIDEIVSGMPAGGPDDIGLAAREVGRSDNPDAQSVLDPFGVGMDDYGSGATRAACPYPEGTDDAVRWLEGWEHQRNAEGTGA